jgi:aminoglycoside phosphotransferase family enzyme/predicted kinase
VTTQERTDPGAVHTAVTVSAISRIAQVMRTITMESLVFDVRDHVAELLGPACYPVAPNSVAYVETHISTVFLAGDRVYKLKKPVDFGFVDYSTLPRRRRFCELEVRLNRRLSNGIYLGAAPLVRTVAGLRFEGQGRAVDWAVKMRRVPAEVLWSARLAAGGLEGADMERLGCFLAEFHARAPRVRSHAAVAAADTAWDDNLRDLGRFAGEMFPGALLEDTGRAGGERRRALAPLLTRRLRAGRFVDGHGDLRLEHLCELDGRLHALDCVEFNAALRRVDAASDLAFLLMDLDRNGAPALAVELAAAYMRASGDESLPACDRFYRAERALVRAKVDALAQQDGDRGETDVRRLRERCGRWVALAAGYLQQQTRPVLVAVRGVSGSGKTAVATRLASELGMVWLASDYLRKRAAGSALDAPLPAKAYTDAARHAVYGRMHRTAAWYLARGLPVLLDATYLDPARQRAAADLARRHSVPAVALTLQVPPAVAEERVRARGPGASDVSADAVRAQLARFVDAPFTGVEDVRIDASGTLSETLARARAAVERRA